MKKINAFTLIEMIVSMTLFAILGIGLFSIMIALKKGDAAVSAKLDLNRELYYVTETIAKLIAESGTLDYEEYWNLKQLNSPTSTSNYGNSGPDAFISCGSSDSAKRDVSSCSYGANQRYGQYTKSFIDTNGDANDDKESCENQGISGKIPGDSNCDGNVFGDEDDEHTGIGPGALGASNGTGTGIIYNSIYKGTLALIKTSSIPQQRLLIRHAFVEDPDDTIHCDSLTGNGCRGELQIRRLEGYDLGFNHGGTGTGANDGQVDTWVCSPLFPCKSNNTVTLPNGDSAKLPNDDPTEWISLFPQHIHIPSLEWIVGPSDDPRQSWQLGSAVSSQFVRMRITLSFSARVRNKFGKNFAPTTLVSTFRIGDDSQ